MARGRLDAISGFHYRTEGRAPQRQNQPAHANSPEYSQTSKHSLYYRTDPTQVTIRLCGQFSVLSVASLGTAALMQGVRSSSCKELSFENSSHFHEADAKKQVGLGTGTVCTGSSNLYNLLIDPASR